MRTQKDAVGPTRVAIPAATVIDRYLGFADFLLVNLLGNHFHSIQFGCSFAPTVLPVVQQRG